jgi:hypothetical protein
MSKIFYVIFTVTRLAGTRRRVYLGKQITTHPRDRYLGEENCPGLAQSITAHGRHAFRKDVIKLCDSEDEMNQEYDRLVTEALAKYKWKYFNKPRKQFSRSKQAIENHRNVLKEKFKNGELRPWNKGIKNYQKHSEEFKQERSRSYLGEGNPNFKHGKRSILAKKDLTKSDDSGINTVSRPSQGETDS